MRFLIMVWVSLVVVPWQAQANRLDDGVEICLIDFISEMDFSSRFEFEHNIVLGQSFPEFHSLYKANLRCIERDYLWQGLDMISITFEFAALASLACTGGAGVPASIAFGFIGLTTHVAKFFVRSLPCQSGDDEIAKKVFKQEMCRLINSEGGHCDLSKVRLVPVDINSTRTTYL